MSLQLVLADGCFVKEALMLPVLIFQEKKAFQVSP